MSQFKTWKRVGEKDIAVCDFQEVIDLLDNNQVIQIDTESTGLHFIYNDLMSVQFGVGGKQYLIKWDEALIPILRDYFLSDRRFIFINGKFDLKFLLKHGLSVKNSYDIFLVEKIIYNDGFNFKGRFSYQGMVERYIGEHISKEIRSSIPELGLIDEVISYALDDVLYLYDIARKQNSRIKEFDLADCVRLENRFLPVLSYTEVCGFKMNPEKWRIVYEENIKRQREIVDELAQIILTIPKCPVAVAYDIFNPGKPTCHINWSSSSQVIPIMKFIGVNVEVNDGGETKESVDASVLENQKNIHPLVSKYLEYKEYTHLIKNFGIEYLDNINKETGRIYATYKQLMGTGRVSCGNKNELESPNIQQIPAEERFRSCFVAEPGNKLIACDYSSQEAYLFASNCADPKLLAFYDSGETEIYCYVAKLVFPNKIPKDMPLLEVKEKFKDLRKIAKVCALRTNYGGTGGGLGSSLGISKEAGMKVYQGYMSSFPGIADYFEESDRISKENGFILCDKVFRRKYFFDEIKDPAFERSILAQRRRNSINYPNQGAAAAMTKLAAILIYEEILKRDLIFVVKIVALVHDEIIVECPDKLADEWAIIIQEKMSESSDLFCQRLKIRSVAQVADHWVH